MDNFSKQQFLTPKEVAEKLKINLLTVYSYIRKKKLTAIRIGTNYRIDRIDFEKFIELNKTQ
jgi:excisionase family DNA binding protein